MTTALASRATEQHTFQSVADTAAHILKDGRLEEARQACRALTETHPGQPRAWFLHGAAALEAGDATTAIEALERAIMLRGADTRYKRMLEFCGLDWDRNCVASHKTDRTVRTWSDSQVRQPVYKTSVSHWREFATHLKPLLNELNVNDAPAHGAH